MPSTEYEMDSSLEEMLKDMIADQHFAEFGELREYAISVLTCVKVNMDADGQAKPCKGDPVTVKKIGPVERMFIPNKPHFIMVVDYGAWGEANTKLRQAMIHRGLMRINAEKTDEGVKVCTRKPDIVEFSTTVARFGAYTDPLLTLREAFRDATHRIIPQLADGPEEEGGEVGDPPEE